MLIYDGSFILLLLSFRYPNTSFLQVMLYSDLKKILCWPCMTFHHNMEYCFKMMFFKEMLDQSTLSFDIVILEIVSLLFSFRYTRPSHFRVALVFGASYHYLIKQKKQRPVTKFTQCIGFIRDVFVLQQNKSLLNTVHKTNTQGLICNTGRKESKG